MRGIGYGGLKRTVLMLALICFSNAPAAAQWTGGRRVAIDSVVGVQDLFDTSRDWPTVGMFDLLATSEVRRRLQISVRPKLWRMDGNWELLLDQASIQYEFQKGSRWRIEAGRFPSPMGLGMTENRPSINGGVLWWHRPYYMPLPTLGAGAPRVSLVSAIYPIGMVVNTSGDHWDARAAVVDDAPVRFWAGDTGPDRHANVIVGGGLTPRQGVRVGVATSWGDLTHGPTGAYRMVNVEGEYAFGHTRLSGEWTRDRFDVASGRHAAWGWTLQGQQTISPRWFVHARATEIRSPEVRTTVLPRLFRSLDATVGYRVDPEVTLRVGYSAVKGTSASTVDHEAGVSLMWARRWW